jgi:hypothetical protein
MFSIKPLAISLSLLVPGTAAWSQSVAISLSGQVTDSAGTPVSGATVKLQTAGLTASTSATGDFVLSSGTTGSLHRDPLRDVQVHLLQGSVWLQLPIPEKVSVQAFGLQGQSAKQVMQDLPAGSHSLRLPELPTGLSFLKVSVGNRRFLVQAMSLERGDRALPSSQSHSGTARILGKMAATAMYDVVTVEKTGFQKAYVSLSTSDSSGMKIKLLKEGTTKFSFFVTSLKALQELSKNNNGFGGDFRFGETGPGAGLRGADKICATIAEKSLSGSSVKGWRAFLSVTADASGKQLNAIDRIGEGPWHDRLGRLVSPKKADLLNTRPMNGDPAIQNDLPNEHGVPNHRPDPNLPADDNHHTVTGSSATGTLASATATCKDWTTSDGASTNGKPMCGFSWPRGSGSSGSNWMSTFSAAGCAPGYHFDNSGGQASATGNIIGNNGGYGGFYCFALNP